MESFEEHVPHDVLYSRSSFILCAVRGLCRLTTSLLIWGMTEIVVIIPFSHATSGSWLGRDC